jgi:hypothetical protein
VGCGKTLLCCRRQEHVAFLQLLRVTNQDFLDDDAFEMLDRLVAGFDGDLALRNGMRQRVALARPLHGCPRLVILTSRTPTSTRKARRRSAGHGSHEGRQLHGDRRNSP